MHHMCSSCRATSVEIQCTTLTCAFIYVHQRWGGVGAFNTQNPLIYFLCNKLITHLMLFIYTNIWCGAASLLLGCERPKRAGSFVKNSRRLPNQVVPAHETCLENFKPSSRLVRVTFAGCNANTGAIGICVWLLFLLISCAIRLADEKRERCHHSCQRYHQAGARVCRAISY